MPEPTPRILVVEDEIIVAHDIQIQLETLGYDHAGHTTTGEQAVVLAGSLRPDLVLMDVQLAGAMDGITAAELISTQYNIPIVYLTAFAADNTIARAKVTQPLGYILKPFAERELRTVLEMALYRHEVETRLRVHQAIFTAFVRHSPIYAYVKEVTSTESRVLHASDIFLEMIGIPGWEMVGKTMAELFPPELAAKMLADDFAVVSRGESLQVEEMLNDRQYLTFKYPITLAGRTLLAGYSIDITERKRAESELRVSEQRYRDQFDLASEGIFTLSTEGELLEVNASFARMHGYHVEEMRGMHLKDLDTPDTAARVPERMRRLLDGESLQFEVEHYHKDGHAFPMELSASLVSSGETSTILCFHRDISERKRLEAAQEAMVVELRASNVELEQFNRAMVGRELRMIALKEEVNELCRRLGEPLRHEMSQFQTAVVSEPSPVAVPPGGARDS